FHAAHKLLLLAHSPKHYTELGRLVAGAKGLPPTEVENRFGTLFMSALRVRATAKKHVTVLHHILGYLKRDLDGRDKMEVLELIADYHRGLVPLVVPLTLLKHHLARIPVPYLADQIYLSPHPKELMLRNHV
ncbi:MAG TPA: YbgA family protein, partial [Candidatus Methylomirabilis sp.]|nr:YbgA family protein [Candidatus Methylomirabilis sp.]